MRRRSRADATASPRTGRRGVAVGALVIAAAAVIVAVVVVRGGRTPKPQAPVAAAEATTVQRRNLVTSINASGTISYAGSSTVTDQLLGTLTWVASVGSVIDPGQRLFDVDNYPVFLMSGTTPAYRTLDASDSDGPDIQQLNANLIDLGYNPDGIVDDDEWQPATTAGLDAFQADQDEPETGSLTLGTVVFLRGAQRVASLQSSATTASFQLGAAHSEFVDDATPVTTATTTQTPATKTQPVRPRTTRPRTVTTTKTVTTLSPAISQLTNKISRLTTQVGQLEHQIKVLQLKRSRSATRPKTPANLASPAGPASGGDSPVMTTTSTNLVVTVKVAAGTQSITHPGARVPVLMPSGATVHGHVVEIGQAASASKVPITIRLDKPQNARNLDQAAVNVRFVEKTARHALSVPLTALVARPGGRYAVQTAKPPYRLINVTLGTFATGFVQISGPGLRPGLKITDSQG